MQDIRDAEDQGRQENGVQRVESLLLGFSPGPRVILLGEQDDGCDNVGVIGNEFSVKVRKAKEGAYTFDGGWRMPIPNSNKFCRIHANEALTNDHS